MTDPKPWQCPSCRAWIRPDVTEHHCDPDGGSLAKLPVRPQAPPMVGEKSPEPAVVAAGGAGGASTITWTFPPGTVVTTTAGSGMYDIQPSGPATTSISIDGRQIWQQVQREAQLYNIRNARRPDAA